MKDVIIIGASHYFWPLAIAIIFLNAKINTPKLPIRIAIAISIIIFTS